MGDVGEETHVHLVGTVLQLGLLFCDAQAQFVRLQADDETDQLVHCEQGGENVEQDCRPSQPGGGFDHDLHLLLADDPVREGLDLTELEAVLACGNLGVYGARLTDDVDPVRVVSVEFVLDADRLLVIVDGPESDLEGIVVVSQDATAFVLWDPDHAGALLIPDQNTVDGEVVVCRGHRDAGGQQDAAVVAPEDDVLAGAGDASRGKRRDGTVAERRLIDTEHILGGIVVDDPFCSSQDEGVVGERNDA